MKPIIFSTEMAQAILEGRKSVTRRVVKPQPNNVEMLNGVFSCGLLKIFYDFDEGINIKSPYQVGDILWVRETFRYVSIGEVSYEGETIWQEDIIQYKASQDEFYEKYKDYIGEYYKWKPSIHMPKEAARIFLKVTDIRVERLQDITEEQAIKEGVVLPSPKANYVNSFIPLWDNLNSKRGYGWDTNPWVWVIEFERVEVEDGNAN